MYSVCNERTPIFQILVMDRSVHWPLIHFLLPFSAAIVKEPRPINFVRTTSLARKRTRWRLPLDMKLKSWVSGFCSLLLEGCCDFYVLVLFVVRVPVWTRAAIWLHQVRHIVALTMLVRMWSRMTKKFTTFFWINCCLLPTGSEGFGERGNLSFYCSLETDARWYHFVQPSAMATHKNWKSDRCILPSRSGTQAERIWDWKLHGHNRWERAFSTSINIQVWNKLHETLSQHNNEWSDYVTSCDLCCTCLSNVNVESIPPPRTSQSLELSHWMMANTFSIKPMV